MVSLFSQVEADASGIGSDGEDVELHGLSSRAQWIGDHREVCTTSSLSPSGSAKKAA